LDANISRIVKRLHPRNFTLIILQIATWEKANKAMFIKTASS